MITMLVSGFPGFLARIYLPDDMIPSIGSIFISSFWRGSASSSSSSSTIWLMGSWCVVAVAEARPVWSVPCCNGSVSIEALLTWEGLRSPRGFPASDGAGDVVSFAALSPISWSHLSSTTISPDDMDSVLALFSASSFSLSSSGPEFPSCEPEPASLVDEGIWSATDSWLVVFPTSKSSPRVLAIGRLACHRLASGKSSKSFPSSFACLCNLRVRKSQIRCERKMPASRTALYVGR